MLIREFFGRKFVRVLCIIGVLFLTFWGGYTFFLLEYCPTRIFAHDEFGRSPVIDSNRVDRSYTLFSPFVASENYEGSGRVYLVDLFGKPVHTWETRYQTLYSQLERNGNIVVAMIVPDDIFSSPGGGQTGLIQELDWQGKVLWEYRHEFMHHDFDILPNGNIALMVWEKTPLTFSEKVRGGLTDPKVSSDVVWADSIIEVNREGRVVWVWHAYEHLDPTAYVLGPLTPRSEWTHANSIRYFGRNPLNGKEGFLVSMRHLNRIILIDKDDGSVSWESPEGMFTYQHDATLLSNGHILGFDNGLFREQRRPFHWSRVIEADPETNKIVWEWNGGDTGIEKAGFAASIMSGAQRLKNGNTLITHSLVGRLLEVDPKGKIVWDFVSPWATSLQTGPFRNTAIFKARRYSPDEISWPELISDPFPRVATACFLLEK